MALANTTSKTERHEFRLTSSDRALLTRAAELSGLKLSDFVLATLRERAEETLQKHDVIVLTGQDRADFINALMNPPKANAKLAQRAGRLKGQRAACRLPRPQGLYLRSSRT